MCFSLVPSNAESGTKNIGYKSCLWKWIPRKEVRRWREGEGKEETPMSIQHMEDLTMSPKAWRMEQLPEGASPPWWKVNLWLLTSSTLLSSTCPQAKVLDNFTPFQCPGSWRNPGQRAR